MQAIKTRLAATFENTIAYNMQPSVRHYLDMLYVSVFLESDTFSDVLIEILSRQETIKVQPLVTVLYIAGYYLLFRQFKEQSQFNTIYKLVALNIGNNTSFSRYLSQYIVTKLLDTGKIDMQDAESRTCAKIMERNKENIVLQKLFEEVIGRYHGIITNLTLVALLKSRFVGERMEIAHGYICDQFKEVSVQATISQTDDSIATKPDQACLQALDSIYGQLEQEAQGEEDAIFQRKIDNVLSIFPVGESSRIQRPSEIVIVASLLQKLPNLANLTRTCEIFGAKELVIPSKSILKDQEFLSVTVTAEKWLPFVECPPEKLAHLLRMYKDTGYSVVCFSPRSLLSNRPPSPPSCPSTSSPNEWCCCWAEKRPEYPTTCCK